MTTASARDKVKNRFNIPLSVTALDTIIDGLVSDATDLLNNYVRLTATATTVVTYTTTSFTVASGRTVIDLSLDDGLNKPVILTDWYQEDTTIKLTGSFDGTITYRYKTNYTTSDLTSLPTEYNQPFLNLCYSEFSTFLAGDRSAYSMYTQSAGARAVDNMIDLAQFYEQKAERQFATVEQSEGSY